MDNSRMKSKRQRKRQSRTEVLSDSSDSEDPRPNEVVEKVEKVTVKEDAESRRKPASRQRASVLAEPEPLETAVSEVDPKISVAFRGYYMQRLATEFAEDLDQMRSADDFNDAALPVLVQALEQGVSMFTPEEQQRLVVHQN